MFDVTPNHYRNWLRVGSYNFSSAPHWQPARRCNHIRENAAQALVQQVRPVVTGHNAEGRSVFIMDGEASAVKEMESMPGLALTDLCIR